MFVEEFDLIRMVEVEKFHYPVERFTYPESIVRMMNDAYSMHLKTDEYLYCIAMDTQCKPTGIFMLAKGSPNCAYMNPKDLYSRMLLVGATQFVMVHNHPGGTPTPSNSDIELTKKIAQSSELMGLIFQDHLIISGEEDYYSFAEDAPDTLRA